MWAGEDLSQNEIAAPSRAWSLEDPPNRWA